MIGQLPFNEAARGADTNSVAVTGVGMVTSLATGLVPSCAAARAGMSRLTNLDLESANTEGEREPVRGHCARDLTEGFVGVGRLLRLAAAAIDDLAEAGASEWEGGTALFVHVRDRYYELVAHSDEVGEDLATLSAGIDQELRDEWSTGDARAKDLLLGVLGNRLHVSEQHRILTRGGAATSFATLQEAMVLLRRGTVRRCVVGAIDSLVDPRVALLLETLGMLKTLENPTGFAPGEAATFMVLERPGTTPAQANLGGLGFARSRSHRFASQAPNGRELRDLLLACEASLGRELDAQTLVCNLSGDDYTTRDLTCALIALDADRRPSSAARLRYPAISFGETGAASALTALGVAIRSLARDDLQGTDVLVASLSEDGGRGAAVVTRTSEAHKR